MGRKINARRVAGELNPLVPQCPLGDGKHVLTYCAIFRAMSVKDRWRTARHSVFCLNCFAATHQLEACDSAFRCRYCQQAHHSLLHYHDQRKSRQTTCIISLTDDESDDADQAPTVSNNNSFASELTPAAFFEAGTGAWSHPTGAESRAFRPERYPQPDEQPYSIQPGPSSSQLEASSRLQQKSSIKSRRKSIRSKRRLHVVRRQYCGDRLHTGISRSNYQDRSNE